MEYIKLFNNHTQYETFINGGGVAKPNVSHCVEENHVHYNPFIDYSKKYLTFNILESGSIDWSRTAYMGDIPISYSLDSGETWTEIGGNSVQHDWIRVNAGDKVIFKGNNRYGYGISEYCTFSGSTASFNVEGNIMSLISGDSFTDSTESTIGEYEFYNFFKGTNIVNAENLVLPATTLAGRCYYSMFSGCRSLTTAPELTATTLASGCYYRMFEGCTSLTTAPELPATALVGGCYAGMFAGCTSLTTALELPATALAEGCYAGMFDRCTSLTTAPELPATALAEGCYSSMFFNCTSLTTAPELPATALANECYKGMFAGCTNLTAAPELPATELSDVCYDSMFKGCTSLTTAPELPAETLATYCYAFMFQGCRSLTTAPQLLATTLASNCYYRMFEGCTSLTTAPELPATTLVGGCYYGMFYNCINIPREAVVPSIYTSSNKMSSDYCSYMYGATPLSYNSGTSVFEEMAYSTYVPPK